MPKKLIYILIFAGIVRIMGIFWGIATYDGFEFDEWQHVSIARNLISKFDSNIIPKEKINTQWNARAFGSQIALIGYPIIKLTRLSSEYLFLIGRLLSVFYGLLLIVLVYFMAAYIFKNKNIALLACAIISVCDLAVTYSHYSTPDTIYVFYAYLAIFFAMLLRDYLSSKPINDLWNISPQKWLILGFPFAIALTMSTRFDLSSIVLFVFAFFVSANKKNIKEYAFLWIIMFFIICGSFLISVASDYNLTDFLRSKAMLSKDNFYVVLNRQNVKWNPLLYFFALLSGTGVFVITGFFTGWFYKIKGKRFFDIKHVFFLIYLGSAFFILSLGSATFVRRALVFVPYIAIMSAYGIYTIADNFNCKKILIGLTLTYTAMLMLLSQKYFLYDNRYSANKFLHKYVSEENITKILYDSNYSKIKRMPAGDKLNELGGNLNAQDDILKYDLLVLHESFYARYWKYFTTPFQIPANTNEIYHGSEIFRSIIQSVILGQMPYKLIKEFPINHLFPERLLFKHLFGTYETSLGDVRIYRKTDQ
ncbi:MAG: hypothetical protein ABH857_01880 [Elusimicrobiota bacterium]